MGEKKYRILLFNTAHRWIGEAATTHLLANELADAGHTVRCLIPEISKFKNRLDDARYEIARVSWPVRSIKESKSLRRQYISVQHQISDFNPDVIHVGRGKEHWCIAILRLFSFRKIPIVRTRHVVLPMRQNLVNRLLFRFGVDAVTAISQAAMDGLGKLGGHLKQEKRKVIYGAVSLKKFSPEKKDDEIRNSFGITGDKLLVGQIGRWQKIKGQEMFIRAILKVREKTDRAMSLISGRHVNPSRHSVARCQEQYKLDTFMHLREEVDDIAALIASLDIGVIASQGSEGFSRIAAEFMASGVPIVSTTVGALPEMLEHEKTALLVDHRDEDAMAEAILRLVQDENLRRCLVENGLKTVHERFTSSRMREEILQVYRQVL